MNDEQRISTLEKLADGIARRRLIAPTRIALEALSPVAFIASQVAVFLHPFTPSGQWRNYVIALEEERGWKLLQSLVTERDS